MRTEIFRVSTLFRSKQTAVRVKKAMLRLQELEFTPQLGQHEFVLAKTPASRTRS